MSRILVVDDEQNWLELIRERLEDLGNEVIAVRDVLKAYEVLDDESLDLVVLDVQMPLNGRAFLWYSESTKPDLPVIIHSAYGSLRFDHDFDGKAGFAVKSPDLVELTKMVEGVLGSQSRAGTDAAD